MTKTLVGTPDPDEPDRRPSITWTGSGMTIDDGGAQNTTTYGTGSTSYWTITRRVAPGGTAG